MEDTRGHSPAPPDGMARASRSALQDEFLSILVHEIRNPLSAMQNAVQLLYAPNLDAERIEWIRALLQRQLKSLTRLIDDVVDVRHVASGRIELERERVDLGAVVRKSVESAGPAAEARQQTLAVRIEEGLFVDADPARLAQVFANLLSNATKFTPEGGRIEVAAERDWLDADFVVVRVRDTGAGIAPEMLESIFDLSKRRERARSGLGVGLPLARGLVELHGGTLSAASEGPGRGSEFVVRLPTRLRVRER